MGRELGGRVRIPELNITGEQEAEGIREGQECWERVTAPRRDQGEVQAFRHECNDP